MISQHQKGRVTWRDQQTLQSRLSPPLLEQQQQQQQFPINCDLDTTKAPLGPLGDKWTVWIHKNGDPDWNNVKPILEFETAPGFWSAWNWLGGTANDLATWRRPQQKFHFFRSGISPLYEDERAMDGGVLSLVATPSFVSSVHEASALPSTLNARTSQRYKQEMASASLWKQVAMECIGGVLFGLDDVSKETKETKETKQHEVGSWTTQAKNAAVIGFMIQFGLDHDGVLIKIWLACPGWRKFHEETSWVPTSLIDAIRGRQKTVTFKLAPHPLVTTASASVSAPVSASADVAKKNESFRRRDGRDGRQTRQRDSKPCQTSKQQT